MEIDAAVGDLPCVPLASPQNGELAFVLAYPDGIGRDEAGRLVYGRAVEAAALRPILTVGEVVQASPLQLRPIAGSIPTEPCAVLIASTKSTGWSTPV